MKQKIAKKIILLLGKLILKTARLAGLKSGSTKDMASLDINTYYEPLDKNGKSHLQIGNLHNAWQADGSIKWMRES